MQGIKNLTLIYSINRQLSNLAMPIMATSFIQMGIQPLPDMAGRVGRHRRRGSSRHRFGRNPDVDVRFYLLIK